MRAVQGTFDVMTTLVHAVGKVAEWSGMSHLSTQIAKHVPDWVKRSGEQIKCDVQWIARRVEVVTTGPLGELQKAAWKKCVDDVQEYHLSKLDLSSSKVSIPLEQELDGTFAVWKNWCSTENAEKLPAFNQRLIDYRKERAALQLPLSEAHSCAQRVALLALGLMMLQIAQS